MRYDDQIIDVDSMKGVSKPRATRDGPQALVATFLGLNISVLHPFFGSGSNV